jgi:hypothetical protein
LNVQLFGAACAVLWFCKFKLISFELILDWVELDIRLEDTCVKRWTSREDKALQKGMVVTSETDCLGNERT